MRYTETQTIYLFTKLIPCSSNHLNHYNVVKASDQQRHIFHKN